MRKILDRLILSFLKVFYDFRDFLLVAGATIAIITLSTMGVSYLSVHLASWLILNIIGITIAFTLLSTFINFIFFDDDL